MYAPACVSVYHIYACRGLKRTSHPLGPEIQTVGATMRVLEIKTGASGKRASALHLWAISAALFQPQFQRRLSPEKLLKRDGLAASFLRCRYSCPENLYLFLAVSESHRRASASSFGDFMLSAEQGPVPVTSICPSGGSGPWLSL